MNIKRKLLENNNPEGFHGNRGAGILFLTKNTNRFLVLKRSHKIHEPGTWSIPGGAFNPEKESPKQCAKRECFEETGYDCKDVSDFIPAYVYVSPENTFRYYNFICLIPEEFEPQLNEESKSYRWLDLEELQELDNKHFGFEEFLNNESEQLKNLLDNNSYQIFESIIRKIIKKKIKEVIY